MMSTRGARLPGAPAVSRAQDRYLRVAGGQHLRRSQSRRSVFQRLSADKITVILITKLGVLGDVAVDIEAADTYGQCLGRWG